MKIKVLRLTKLQGHEYNNDEKGDVMREYFRTSKRFHVGQVFLVPFRANSSTCVKACACSISPRTKGNWYIVQSIILEYIPESLGVNTFICETDTNTQVFESGLLASTLPNMFGETAHRNHFFSLGPTTPCSESEVRLDIASYYEPPASRGTSNENILSSVYRNDFFEDECWQRLIYALSPIVRDIYLREEIRFRLAEVPLLISTGARSDAGQ